MLLIVGIDGADWSVARPLLERGEMPALASLVAAGTSGRSVSTAPAATFPAWTSFATACEPGEHGIFDFFRRDGYSIRAVSARDRARPSIWQRIAATGLRVAVYNLPAAYPPEPLPGGIFISGFDTPVATEIDASFVHPRELHAELSRKHGPLVISDANEAHIDAGWHARTLARLLDGVRRRSDIALDLLARGPWDVFFVLFGESDTAGHHFWWLHDEASPRHRASSLGGALASVYREIDAALGRMLAAAPAGSTVLVLSDHGMGGAGTRAVSINRRLAEVGLLRFRSGPGAIDTALELARRAALRALPAALQSRLARGATGGIAARVEARSRFAGIDWASTRAFSEDLSYAPSVCINLAGREPAGIVRSSDYDGVCAEVIAALESWRDPETGEGVVARARPRAAVYGAGEVVERAPDVLVDLSLEGGYSSTVRRSGGRAGPSVWRIPPAEGAGSKTLGMNGTHRLHGLYCWSGPGIARSEGRDRSLARLGADVLEHLGLPSTADGSVVAMPSLPEAGEALVDGSDVLERRLRALGYLE